MLARQCDKQHFKQCNAALDLKFKTPRAPSVNLLGKKMQISAQSISVINVFNLKHD